MKTMILLLVLVGGLVGLMVATGLWDTLVTSPKSSTESSGESAKENGGDNTTLQGNNPTAGPLEEPKLRRLLNDHRALLISRGPFPWIKLLEGQLGALKKMAFQTWYTDTLNALDPDAGPGSGPGRDLPALTEAPDENYLDEHNIDLLMVDAIDPHVIPDQFWEAVRTRVRDGKMGLWVHPGIPYATNKGDAAPAVHPMLEHAIVKELLPVAAAQEIKGTPVPGIVADSSKQPRPFALTERGAKHPAVRFYDDPEKSKRLWERVSAGKHGWRVRFCYPVTKLADGAVSLVEVDTGTLDDLPAMIVTDADIGRVFWLGTESMGWDALYESTSTGRMHVLMSNWIAWLVGEQG